MRLRIRKKWHLLLLFYYLGLVGTLDLHHTHGVEACCADAQELAGAEDPCPVLLLQAGLGDEALLRPQLLPPELVVASFPSRLRVPHATTAILHSGRAPPAALFH